MVGVKADAEDAAATRDLRRSGVGDLPIAGADLASVAVRADDRPETYVEGVGHGLIGHVAEVEDHTLSPHRFQKLHAEVGQPARGAGAAAVAGAAPGRADDPHTHVRPRSKLRWGLDRVGAFHEHDRGTLPFSPTAHIRLDLA